jgi:hypothetical protein
MLNLESKQKNIKSTKNSNKSSGKRYMSVTKFIDSKFIIPFGASKSNIIGHSKLKSNLKKKSGYQKLADINLDWQLTSDRFSNYGSGAHAFFQQLHLRRTNGLDLEPIMLQEEALVKVYNELIKHWGDIECEIDVNSDLYRLAGRIDIKAINKITNSIGLFDIKLSNDLLKRNIEVKAHKRILGSNINKLEKAALQLQTYKLLENSDISNDALYVIQITHGGDFKIFGGSKKPLPDFTEAIYKELNKRDSSEISSSDILDII